MQRKTFCFSIHSPSLFTLNLSILLSPAESTSRGNSVAILNFVKKTTAEKLKKRRKMRERKKEDEENIQIWFQGSLH